MPNPNDVTTSDLLLFLALSWTVPWEFGPISAVFSSFIENEKGSSAKNETPNAHIHLQFLLQQIQHCKTIKNQTKNLHQEAENMFWP